VKNERRRVLRRQTWEILMGRIVEKPPDEVSYSTRSRPPIRWKRGTNTSVIRDRPWNVASARTTRRYGRIVDDENRRANVSLSEHVENTDFDETVYIYNVYVTDDGARVFSSRIITSIYILLFFVYKCINFDPYVFAFFSYTF